MTLQTNLGFTSKELLSFKTRNDVPKDFSGSCIISKSVLHHYKGGKIHREDGPAVEYPDGDKYWYINNKLHRENGPACEIVSISYKSWYYHGKRHREDGPAIENGDDIKEWYINDKHHRIDGPAVEHADGYKEWWVNGKKYEEDEDFTVESWKHFQRTIIF